MKAEQLAEKYFPHFEEFVKTRFGKFRIAWDDNIDKFYPYFWRLCLSLSGEADVNDNKFYGYLYNTLREKIINELRAYNRRKNTVCVEREYLDSMEDEKINLNSKLELEDLLRIISKAELKVIKEYEYNKYWKPGWMIKILTGERSSESLLRELKTKNRNVTSAIKYKIIDQVRMECIKNGFTANRYNR